MPFRKIFPTLTAAAAYILDTMSNLGADYALRKLRTAYAGSAIRVRRSNDDLVAAIGFDANGELDTTALASHVGSNSGYVETWYDQSGNGNDVTISDPTKQPRIVNAGVIDRDYDTVKAAAAYPTFASASGVTLVSNGDFSNGTTGWAVDGSTLAAASNVLSITGNGSLSYARTRQDTISCVTGKRIYLRFKAKVTNASCTQLGVDVVGSTGGTPVTISQNSPTQDNVYTLTGIVTLTSGMTGNLRFRFFHLYADAATANTKVMELSEVVAIDVTDLGKPCMVFDGSNDCLVRQEYPSTAEANALYPTFASTSGVNLLSNGGFESDLTGWGNYYGAPTIVNDTHSGSKAAKLSKSSSNQVLFSNNLTITSNGRIYVNLWIKKTRYVSSTDIYIGLTNTSGGFGTTIFTNAQFAALSLDTWTNITTVVSANSNWGTGMRIEIGGYSNFDADFIVDDVAIIDVTALDKLNITAQPLYLNSVFSTDSAISADKFLICKNLDDATTIQYALMYSNTNPHSVFYLQGTSSNIASGANNSITKAAQTIQSATWTSNTMQIYDDGSTSGTTDTYSGNPTSRVNFHIGARASTAPNQTWQFAGKISEAHIMSSVANQAALEANQKTYYGIA